MLRPPYETARVQQETQSLVSSSLLQESPIAELEVEPRTFDQQKNDVTIEQSDLELYINSYYSLTFLYITGRKVMEIFQFLWTTYIGTQL